MTEPITTLELAKRTKNYAIYYFEDSLDKAVYLFGKDKIPTLKTLAEIITEDSLSCFGDRTHSIWAPDKKRLYLREAIIHSHNPSFFIICRNSPLLRLRNNPSKEELENLIKEYRVLGQKNKNSTKKREVHAFPQKRVGVEEEKEELFYKRFMKWAFGGLAKKMDQKFGKSPMHYSGKRFEFSPIKEGISQIQFSPKFEVEPGIDANLYHICGEGDALDRYIPFFHIETCTYEDFQADEGTYLFVKKKDEKEFLKAGLRKI
jgi:hypothetical protein